jgi:phage gpG-like protein
MSLQISWEIEGSKELSRVLEGITLGLKDFKRPLQNAADNLVRTFSTDVFNTQGGAINEKWKPLSPVTIAQKARKGQPSDILVATGDMKKSFGSTVGTHQAVVANAAPYFKYHQSKNPRKKLPRRVMMKLAEDQKTMIVKEFQMEFLRITRGRV